MRQSKLQHSTGLKPSFLSLCFWSQKYKNSEKKTIILLMLLRNPFGLGRDHLSPTHVSGCLSISEWHNALRQELSHGQPQLLAGCDKMQRENLKLRNSAIGWAGLAMGSCGSWKSSMARGMTVPSALAGCLVWPHTLICALQQLSLWSWPTGFFIFSPVTL